MLSQSLLITIGLIAGVFLFTIYAFANNSWMLMCVLIAIPPLIFLVNRSDILLVLILSLFYSTLTLPIFPQNFNMFYVLALMFVMIMIANRIISKEQEPWTVAHRFLMAFFLVVLITAGVRGAGLRAFGGSAWGGAGYILLAIGIGLYMLSRYVPLSGKQASRAVYGFCLLTFLPPAAQLLYALSGGKLWQQYYFVTPDYAAVFLLRGIQKGEEMMRVQNAGWFGYQLCLLSLMVPQGRFRNRVLQIFLLGSCFVLSGVSGHRLTVVLIVVTCSVFFSLASRAGLARFINRYTIALAAGTILLAVFARHLPLTYQRALSVIPFANVSLEAKMNADSTSTWRMEIWQRMLREIPRYVLMGRGFTFSAEDVMLVSSGEKINSVEQAFATHNYHNGPLSLLIDLGLAGFVCASGFMLAVLYQQYKRVNAPWRDRRLQRLHAVLYASYVALIVIFYAIFGDARSSLVQMMVWAIMMESLSRADARQATPARHSELSSGARFGQEAGAFPARKSVIAPRIRIG
jgi:hypothetical protein